MTSLTNQTILILSPQRWNHIHVSKHHYAIELARRGNAVYFLEPPDGSGSGKVLIVDAPGHPEIRLVQYRPPFPLSIRFHARPLFDALMLRQVKLILRTLGVTLDILWSFEPNLFSNLRIFGAHLSVYHPVDALIYPYQIRVAKSADLVLSVSAGVVSQMEALGVPAWFINHGLSEPFAEVAREWTEIIEPGGNRRPRAGYAGNLMHPPVNRPVLRNIILGHPGVQFHFWGPYTAESRREQPSLEQSFVDFLMDRPNVVLHGSVSTMALAAEMRLMDCLLLSYTGDHALYDRSNSHKMMEYLSTGKVIVSSRIAAYSGLEHLIRMPSDSSDLQLPALFSDALVRLIEFNSPKLQIERMRFALDNTYERQVERIAERLVSSARNCS